MNGEDDIIMETAMSKRGDRLKLVILEKRGDMEYDIVDVYELHTEKYDGRVAGVVNILEEIFLNCRYSAPFKRSPARCSIP